MIRKPTLFVLGAGTSHPYGFPLGSGLRHAICHAESQGDAATALIHQLLRLHPDHFRPVARAFKRSSEKSIDAFLTRNPQYAEAGRALIAANLCTLEDPNYFYENDIGDHWYEHLWNHLIDDTIDAHQIGQNKARFITFNYDRSLEYFLHESAKNTYPCLSDEQAQHVLKPLSILHVYGSLGTFTTDHADPLARAYAKDHLTARDLQIAAKSIKLIPDDRGADDKIFQQGRKWFDWAEYVYILGFGFDRINCQRLGFDSVVDHKLSLNQQPPRVTASVVGLTHNEKQAGIVNLFRNINNFWTAHAGDCTSTLRNNWPIV